MAYRNAFRDFNRFKLWVRQPKNKDEQLSWTREQIHYYIENICPDEYVGSFVHHVHSKFELVDLLLLRRRVRSCCLKIKTSIFQRIPMTPVLPATFSTLVALDLEYLYSNFIEDLSMIFVYCPRLKNLTLDIKEQEKDPADSAHKIQEEPQEMPQSYY
jgi:hypothetical protein